MSLSTNGWDLVYKMRLDAVNKELKDNSFSNRSALKNELVKKIASGYNGKIVAKVISLGSDYTKAPSIAVRTFEQRKNGTTNIPTKNEFDTEFTVKYGINSIQLNETNIKSGDTIEVENKSGNIIADITVIDTAIESITIDGSAGTKYKKDDIINLTGGFSNPSANDNKSAVGKVKKIGRGGKIEEIEIVSGGKGYSTATLSNIKYTVVTEEGENAKFTASIGVGISVNTPGAYNTILSISSEVKVKDSSGTSKPGFTIKSINLGVSKLENTGNYTGYTIPPIIEIIKDPSDALAEGAFAVAALGFTDTTTNIVKTNTSDPKKYITDTITKIFKVGGYTTILKTASVFNTNFIFPEINFSEVPIPNATKDQKDQKVLNYLYALMDNVIDKLWEKNSNYKENIDLRFLSLPEEEVYKTDQKNLTESLKDLYGLTDVLINLKNDEKDKIKSRMLAGLQNVDNSILYNLEKTPGEPGYEKTLEQLGKQLEDNKEGFLASMIEFFLAIVPSEKSNTITGIFKDNSNANHQLKKIRLETGAMQLATGNDGEYGIINIPLKNGFLLFGDKSYRTEAADIVSNIPLRVNYKWISTSYLYKSKPERDTIKVYFDVNEFENILAKFIYYKKDGTKVQLSDREAILLKAFLEHYFSEKYATVTDDKLVFNNTHHQHYTYQNTLSRLNILPRQALIEKKLYWMYPTRVTMAVQDEARIPANIKNSVLSMSCMTQSRPNNSHATVNINAIPKGASSALLVERSVFAEKMMIKQLVSCFSMDFIELMSDEKLTDEEILKAIKKITSNEKTKANEKIKEVEQDSGKKASDKASEIENLKERIKKLNTLQKIKNDEVLKQLKEFKQLKESSGNKEKYDTLERAKIFNVLIDQKERLESTTEAFSKNGAYAFTNKIELQTKSKDYKNDKDKTVAGMIPNNKVILSAEESSIKVSMSEVKYKYNEDNTPTIDQEYVFNFSLDNNLLSVKSQNKLFNINNDYSPENLLQIGINIGLPLLKHLVFTPLIDRAFSDESRVVRLKYDGKKYKQTQRKIAKAAPPVKINKVTQKPNLNESQNPLNISGSAIEKEVELSKLSIEDNPGLNDSSYGSNSEEILLYKTNRSSKSSKKDTEENPTQGERYNNLIVNAQKGCEYYKSNILKLKVKGPVIGSENYDVISKYYNNIISYNKEMFKLRKTTKDNLEYFKKEYGLDKIYNKTLPNPDQPSWNPNIELSSTVKLTKGTKVFFSKKELENKKNFLEDKPPFMAYKKQEEIVNKKYGDCIDAGKKLSSEEREKYEKYLSKNI